MYVIFILQEYIHREVKPKTKRELIDGIEKVLPEIVRKSGEATGY